MPKLPDPTNIKRRFSLGQSGVSSLDTSAMGRGGQAMAQAVGGMGQTLGQIADFQYAKGEKERKEQEIKTNRLELAIAQSKDTRHKQESLSSMQGHTDYTTYVDTYMGKLSNNNIADGITDPDTRALYEASVANNTAIEEAKAREYKWKLESSHHKAELDDQLTALLNIGTTESLENAHNLIDAMQDKGYISATEATNFRQAQSNAFVVKDIKESPASERSALVKKYKSILSPEQQESILEQAKDESIENEAILTADFWMDEKLTLKEASIKAKSIRDADLRKAVENRFKLMLGTAEAAQRDRQNTLYEDYTSQVENGEISYDNIPRSDRDMMSPAHRANLRALHSERVAPSKETKVETDIAVYDHLNVLIGSGDSREARQYFLDNYMSLSITDRKHFSNLTSKQDYVTVKSLMTSKEYLNNAAEQSGVGKADKLILQQRLDAWYQGYQELNGNKPSDTEIQKAVDGLLLERPEDNAWYNPATWGAGDYMFEEEGAGIESLLNDIPEMDLKATEQAFKSRYGREPDRQELYDLYLHNLQRGNF